MDAIDELVDVRTVVVQLPAGTRFARAARTIAADCCAREAMSIDTVADIRLLVDEVFHALSAIGPGPVTIVLTPVAGHVSLEMSTAARPGCHWGTPTVPFLEMMATAIVDDPLFDEDGGVVRFSALVRD